MTDQDFANVETEVQRLATVTNPPTVPLGGSPHVDKLGGAGHEGCEISRFLSDTCQRLLVSSRNSRGFEAELNGIREWDSVPCC